VTKSTIEASKLSAALRKTEPKRLRLPKGYGTLRGQFVVRPGLDLTKPILEQILKLDKKERRKTTRRA